MLMYCAILCTLLILAMLIALPIPPIAAWFLGALNGIAILVAFDSLYEEDKK